jgi:hypothetical protein
MLFALVELNWIANFNADADQSKNFRMMPQQSQAVLDEHGQQVR